MTRTILSLITGVPEAELDRRDLRARAASTLKSIRADELRAAAPVLIATKLREQRYRPTELRAETVANQTFISGYTARFNVLSSDLGGFRERINRTAFERTLQSGGQVSCTLNHAPSLLIATTRNGSLKLQTDSVGLFFRAQVCDTRIGRDVVAYLQGNFLGECSFGFRAVRDRWDTGLDEDGRTIDIRTLLDVDLFDCGPVLNPAYGSTSVSVERSLFPDGVPGEIRSRLNTRAPVSEPPITPIELAERLAWVR